eukprot:6267448-Lingulodinium_polyedra.AAC.1
MSELHDRQSTTRQADDRLGAVGVGGSVALLNFKDIATRAKCSVPIASFGVEDSVRGLHFTIGDDPVHLTCVDNWGVVTKVCEVRGLFVELVRFGMVRMSVRAERRKQDTLDGFRSILVAVGSFGCFWFCVVPCYANLDNL